MSTPFKSLTPYTPKYVEIFYAAAVPDCAVSSASSSDGAVDALEV